MVRKFKLEKFHTDIISESTLFKTLKYLDKKAVETPFLLIDKEKIREKVSLIGRYIKNSEVYYAVKANPDLKIIDYLNKLNVGFEISSEGELEVLEKLNVNPSKIISSNPVKTIRFLKRSYKYGIRYFSFDSYEEVNKLVKFAPGCSVYVRLTVPNEGSEWPLSKKFGVEIEEGLRLLQYARDRGLKPVGITFHVGSQCTNIYNWNIALDKTKVLWDLAKKSGLELKILNIGGGYPIKYIKNVVSIEAIEKNINKLVYERFPDDIKIHIEPGRAVVGDAGVLVTKVIGKAKRGDEDWLYIDVGVFNGLMESVGGIKYSYIIETDKQTKNKKIWTLAGPSCDSFDVIDKNVSLFEPDVGNLVLVLSSGAYTVSYASEFNGFSIPKTILI